MRLRTARRCVVTGATVGLAANGRFTDPELAEVVRAGHPFADVMVAASRCDVRAVQYWTGYKDWIWRVGCRTRDVPIVRRVFGEKHTGALNDLISLAAERFARLDEFHKLAFLSGELCRA